MAHAQSEEEQQKALMEKLKHMSPDELREFQKKQCIFCQIAEGKMQAKKVYEDEKAIGILDINPANIGHILLLPKEHHAIMPQLPEDILGHLGILAKKLSHALLKALKAGGTTIFIANGASAGQRAQHFMIHIIPRQEKDGVGLFIPQRQIREEDLAKLKDVLAEKISGGKQKGAEKKPQAEKKTEHKAEKKEKGKPARKEKKQKAANVAKETENKNKKDDVSLDDIAGLFGNG